MNAWWVNNWDKVVTLLLGGIIGFFSGILATHQAISELNETVVRIDTKAQTKYDPSYQDVNEIKLKIIGIENELEDIEAQQLLMDTLIDLHTKKFQIELEKVRKDTIDVLTKFVQESKEKP